MPRDFSRHQCLKAALGYVGAPHRAGFPGQGQYLGMSEAVTQKVLRRWLFFGSGAAGTAWWRQYWSHLLELNSGESPKLWGGNLSCMGHDNPTQCYRLGEE